MNKINTKLQDVYILEPKVFGDHRGWFMESWSKKTLDGLGLKYDFVQDNHSFSTVKGTLRGLHFQTGEYAQCKIVRCSKGAVLDVAVDLRKGSPSYMEWIAVELSEENKRQLLIPRGFAHGFLTLTDTVEFLYKADNDYTPMADAGILWNDPKLGVDWGTTTPILSEKDEKLPLFENSAANFIYEVNK